MFRMNWVTPQQVSRIMLCRSVSHDRGRTWSPPQLMSGDGLRVPAIGERRSNELRLRDPLSGELR